MGDFGISRFAFGQDEEHGFVQANDLENPNMIVSLPYRSIELLLGQCDYGPGLDVWSCGCIMGEILLCEGGNRRTFFGGEPSNPNKTPQSTCEEIFVICGRPNEETWPGFSRLPLLKSYCSSGLNMQNPKGQTGIGEERHFIRKFFSGVGKGAVQKYSLTDGCFDLLGELLTLCPERRVSAAEALKHGFFNEKPTPEWHAWHWALNKDEIARCDDMRKQEGDKEDDARRMLRALSQTSLPDEKKQEGVVDTRSLKDRTKEALERRASEQKLLEEKKLAAKRAAERQKGQKPDAEKLPPGWTKHWSSSKQRYYYHDNKTNSNQWVPPAATSRK